MGYSTYVGRIDQRINGIRTMCLLTPVALARFRLKNGGGADFGNQRVLWSKRGKPQRFAPLWLRVVTTTAERSRSLLYGARPSPSWRLFVMGPDCAEVRLTAWGIDRSFGTVDGIAPDKAGKTLVCQPGRQVVPYPQGPALVT